MNVDPKTLIAEIFARPAIWDNKHKCYHNRPYVDKLWLKLADDHNVPVRDLKRKWKYLRDQFRSECKKIPIERANETGFCEAELETYSCWPYFKALLFLKDQIKCRDFIGNLDGKRIAVDAMERLESEAEYVETRVNCEKIDKPVIAGIRVNQDDETRVNYGKIEKPIIAGIHLNQDEDEAFFYSLLPHIRKLEPAQKLLCRMELQSVVFKHVYQRQEPRVVQQPYNVEHLVVEEHPVETKIEIFDNPI
ncbi:uncharacterized protein LOC135706494 [Ochlerotatus camptorhynchus]|uniref:uncharacterized protein LOC135706494 n=1 Tax=Ochlerotatus camptorhynchus TaxID=644619 RepID=UPI0031E40EF6